MLSRSAEPQRFAVHDEETADFGSDHRLLTVDILMEEDVCRATEPIAACVASAGQLPLHLRWSLANVDWGALTVKLRREMADWQRIATPLVDLLPERPRLCDQHGEAGALAQEPAETQVVIDFLERSFKHSLFAAALAVVPVARRSPHAVSWVNDAVRNAFRVREALTEQRRAWRLMLCHEQGGKRKLKEQRKKRKEMDALQDQGQQAQPSGAAGRFGQVSSTASRGQERAIRAWASAEAVGSWHRKRLTAAAAGTAAVRRPFSCRQQASEEGVQSGQARSGAQAVCEG